MKLLQSADDELTNECRDPCRSLGAIEQRGFSMLTIVGFIVVIGSVLGGFSMAGGHFGALVHPSEIVTIGGAALGAMIVMSPMNVLKDLMTGLLQTVKGNPFSKAMYEELFKLLYQLFRKARRDGLLAIEQDIANPHDSPVFKRYPLIANNHHASDFIKGAFGPMVDGSVNAAQMGVLLEFEIRGAGIERAHAERAIDLAVTKYCSVRDTLDPARPIEWTLTLES